MNLPNIKKPNCPNFSCGPTRKPDGWSLKNLDKNFLGRYHRSIEVKNYIRNILKKLKVSLNIPKSYKVIMFPGSCTGAMEAVIWSFLGSRDVSTIIYDYWAQSWFEDLKKIGVKIDVRRNLNGRVPKLENIPKKNDIVFVWTGTSTGMSISNTKFISDLQKGLVISDITSAVFIYDLPWTKLDVSVFSWQKALGSESQHGIIVMSPKALKRIKKKNNPKVLSIYNHDLLVNTPSLLSIADFEHCLDIFNENGGLKNSLKKTIENKMLLDEWEKRSCNLRYFCENKNFQSLSPCYFVLKKKKNLKKIFKFLNNNNVAYDIENYRKAPQGIRIWNGPNIKKNDLIALTNWIDWCFNKL
ncbi:MAG: hypothetical protein ACJ0GH_02290 [Alphaproteobacteria bacterium]